MLFRLVGVLTKSVKFAIKKVQNKGVGRLNSCFLNNRSFSLIRPGSQISRKETVMKALKSVFSAFAALFLAVSLSGCLGEEKATSQSGENGSSLFESGGVKLVLEPGDTGIFFYFSGNGAGAAAEGQSAAMASFFDRKGVAVEKNLISGDTTMRILFIKLKEPLSEKLSVALDKTALTSFRVLSSTGSDVAKWDPSLGNGPMRV